MMIESQHFVANTEVSSEDRKRINGEEKYGQNCLVKRRPSLEIKRG